MVLPEAVDLLLRVLVELGPPGINDRVEEAVGVRGGEGADHQPSQRGDCQESHHCYISHLLYCSRFNL